MGHEIWRSRGRHGDGGREHTRDEDVFDVDISRLEADSVVVSTLAVSRSRLWNAFLALFAPDLEMLTLLAL